MLLAQNVQMPPATVTGPVTTLLGEFLWLVFAALIPAAGWAGVAFARAFAEAGGIDRASAQLLVVMACTILAATGAGWGAFLLT